MVSVANKSKTDLRKKKTKAKSMTRTEMVKKMLADQKIIRDAVRKGVPLKELLKKYGFKFASLPSVEN